MTDGFSFSIQLTDRTIAYYKALGESITPEAAQEYLRSMSSLYGSFMAFAATSDEEAGMRSGRVRVPLERSGSGRRASA